jgi:hypothetical protein
MKLKKIIVAFALCTFFMLAGSSCKKDESDPIPLPDPVSGKSDETLNAAQSALVVYKHYQCFYTYHTPTKIVISPEKAGAFKEWLIG